MAFSYHIHFFVASRLLDNVSQMPPICFTKTVQYLAGHESIKITMDIYAKVKYNRPQDLHGPVNAAFAKKGKELA